MNKLSLWCKIKEDGRISFSTYNRLKFIDFITKHNKKDDEFNLVISLLNGKKSKNALGFYFGAILPALVAHNKGLVHQGQIKNNPLILVDLLKSRKITHSEVETMHRDVLLTFRPELGRDLKTGKTIRTGQEMKNYDNGDLYQLTDEIIAWGEENCYEFPASEDYKNLINKL